MRREEPEEQREQGERSKRSKGSLRKAGVLLTALLPPAFAFCLSPLLLSSIAREWGGRRYESVRFMRVLQLRWLELPIAGVPIAEHGRRMIQRVLWLCLTLLVGLGLLGTPPALAGLTDDRYDGEIFTLYAGNGSLVPPKFTLAEALKRDRPALLYFYVDDSKDCKAYTAVISQLQAFYGKAADLLPIRVDAIPSKPTYTKTEPGYYYAGVVPQVVLFDASGKVVLNENGVVPFETIDAKLRELFDLLPRSQSVVLKRRQVNEVTTELAQ